MSNPRIALQQALQQVAIMNNIEMLQQLLGFSPTKLNPDNSNLHGSARSLVRCLIAIGTPVSELGNAINFFDAKATAETLPTMPQLYLLVSTLLEKYNFPDPNTQYSQLIVFIKEWHTYNFIELIQASSIKAFTAQIEIMETRFNEKINELLKTYNQNENKTNKIIVTQCNKMLSKQPSQSQWLLVYNLLVLQASEIGSMADSIEAKLKEFNTNDLAVKNKNKLAKLTRLKINFLQLWQKVLAAHHGTLPQQQAGLPNVINNLTKRLAVSTVIPAIDEDQLSQHQTTKKPHKEQTKKTEPESTESKIPTSSPLGSKRAAKKDWSDDKVTIKQIVIKHDIKTNQSTIEVKTSTKPNSKNHKHESTTQTVDIKNSKPVINPNNKSSSQTSNAPAMKASSAAAPASESIATSQETTVQEAALTTNKSAFFAKPNHINKDREFVFHNNLFNHQLVSTTNARETLIGLKILSKSPYFYSTQKSPWELEKTNLLAKIYAKLHLLRDDKNQRNIFITHYRSASRV